MFSALSWFSVPSWPASRGIAIPTPGVGPIVKGLRPAPRMPINLASPPIYWYYRSIMGELRTVRAVRSLAVILLLQAGTMTRLALSGETYTVHVLCTPDLPESLPACEAVAAALDLEIEEFGMHAIAQAWPGDGVPGAAAGADVQFTVWEWVEGARLEIHVSDHANDVRVAKSLDLSSLSEFPEAVDIAILAKNLMGASLYASLAALSEEDLLVDLAVPPEKEATILDRAADGKEALPAAPPAPRWAPQILLGWGLISYPGQHNVMSSTWDTYNGIALAVRFPFAKYRMWMGFSVFVTQSLEDNPTSELNEAIASPFGVTSSVFTDDQIVMALDLAWVPLLHDRVQIWLSAGPGLTRVAWKVLAYYDPDALDGLLETFMAKASLTVLRVTIGGGFGLAIRIVDRVRLETGLRETWCSSLGSRNAALVFGGPFPELEHRMDLPFEHGAAGITFWLAMVFG